MGFLVMIDDHMTNAIEDQDHLLLYATCKLGCPLPKRLRSILQCIVFLPSEPEIDWPKIPFNISD